MGGCQSQSARVGDGGNAPSAAKYDASPASKQGSGTTSGAAAAAAGGGDRDEFGALSLALDGARLDDWFDARWANDAPTLARMAATLRSGRFVHISNALWPEVAHFTVCSYR
jgi:hypothetical protein